MSDVLTDRGTRTNAESDVKECQIKSARDSFEKIRMAIRSALDREVHGWIWALEQMTAEMRAQSSLSSDVKAWKGLIEAYDALFELVRPRVS